MRKVNNFDGSIIYNEIQKDITSNKMIVLLSGFIFLFLLMVITPVALTIFFSFFIFADLPYFDLDFIDKLKCTKIFLLPYDILLIFYFIVMYFHDKKLHLVNKEHYRKATKYFIISLVITVVPFIFTSHILLTGLYFVFFLLTVYHLSLTYYDVEIKNANNIHSRPMKSEDLGWMSSHGLMDNPFMIQDDLNRTKFFIQSSMVGFDFIILFIHTIVKSIKFTHAINDGQYVQESARLFDLILEDELDGDYVNFSEQSKIILESINYLSFRNGIVVLYERGKAVSKLANIKETK